MRKFGFAFLGILAVWTIACKGDSKPYLHGYMLGESVSSFASESHLIQNFVSSCKGSLSGDCAAVNKFTNKSYSGFIHCYKDDVKETDFCKGSISHYGFSNGKLVVIQVKEHNTWQSALDLLTAQYGKPSEIKSGSGKLANAREAIWTKSKYRLSLNGFLNDPSKNPTIYAILQTPEHYDKAHKQQEDSQKTHDEMLGSYLETINHQKELNAKLSAKGIPHDPLADSIEKSTLDMTEVLLEHEVRTDESADAIY